MRVSWIPAGAANFSRSFLFTVGFKAFSICFGRFSVPVFRTGSNGICPSNIWIFFAPRCGARKIWQYSLLSTHPFGGVAIGLLLELSDAEHYTGTWSLAYFCSSKALIARCIRHLRFVLTCLFYRSGSCEVGVAKECYLVDPASSHMLVSKIKPCMCKYELIQTVKLRMAH